jgi:hypothetical protein
VVWSRRESGHKLIDNLQSTIVPCHRTLPPHQRSPTFSIGCRPTRPKTTEKTRKFKNPLTSSQGTYSSCPASIELVRFFPIVIKPQSFTFQDEQEKRKMAGLNKALGMPLLRSMATVLVVDVSMNPVRQSIGLRPMYYIVRHRLFLVSHLPCVPSHYRTSMHMLLRRQSNQQQ